MLLLAHKREEIRENHMHYTLLNKQEILLKNKNYSKKLKMVQLLNKLK